MNISIIKSAFLFIIVVSLSACGGGGSGESSGIPSGETVGAASGNTAEGLWGGTTNTGRAIAGLVLDNGEYWVIYSSVGNSAVLGGVVQGNSVSSNGAINSSNGRDFNLEGLGIIDGTLAGTYVAKSSLAGTVTYSPNSSTIFTSIYDNSYDLTPSLGVIAGTYSGSAATSGGIEFATVTISDLGAMNGMGASGCGFTGNATPRTRGNVYNVSVTFGGGVCANGTTTVTGVAYFDASTNQLTSAALNSTRTDGFIYMGVKP
jgi:hypothetical protein